MFLFLLVFEVVVVVIIWLLIFVFIFLFDTGDYGRLEFSVDRFRVSKKSSNDLVLSLFVFKLVLWVFISNPFVC